MNIKQVIYLFLLILCAGCNSNDKPVARVAAPVAAKPVLAEPFKFHKMLEVAPGNYYDVFSWGRGTVDGGQYMILRSDSADQQYNAVNGDLEGPVQDVFNADMDIDGNPEIIICARSIDTNRRVNVFVYEYQNDNARKLDFPRLTEQQRNGYRGGDVFYIKDSKLMREFPIYNGKGKEAALTGQKRLIQYSLQSNVLYAKQISKDSSKVEKSVTPVKETNKPKTPSGKKHKSVSKKKKSHTKHTAAAKKHHKHRR